METTSNLSGTTGDGLSLIDVTKRLSKFHHCFHTTKVGNRSELTHEKGVRMKKKINSEADLSLKVVISETCITKFLADDIHLQLQLDRAQFTTIGGICTFQLEKTDQLRYHQLFNMNEEEKKKHVENIQRRLRSPIGLTLILNDYCGNTYLENADETSMYERTPEQNQLFQRTIDAMLLKEDKTPRIEPEYNGDDAYFKEVTIRMVKYLQCHNKKEGVNRSELIDEKAVEIRKKINNEADLSLKVLMSETCLRNFPEIELNMGAKETFTTIGGLCEELLEFFQRVHSHPSVKMDDQEKKRFDEIIYPGLKSPIGLTVVLDDMAGNSCIENADEIRRYDRTAKQNQHIEMIFDKLLASGH